MSARESAAPAEGVADKVGQQAQHGGGIDSRLQDTEPPGCNGIPVAVSRLCGELTRPGQEFEAACDVGIPDAAHQQSAGGGAGIPEVACHL
jgi:hypothetical protein